MFTTDSPMPIPFGSNSQSVRASATVCDLFRYGETSRQRERAVFDHPLTGRFFNCCLCSIP
jgi:hypothetical protein